MDSLGRAYGAGMASGKFDPVTFIKKPQVILRIVSWVFSIIVFGCIASGGWADFGEGGSTCLFSGDAGACGFGTAIGVLAFLACIVFIAVDAYFDNISSVQLRKQVVIGDLGASGVFAFLYFVTFCYLTNKWTSREFPDNSYAVDPPQAAIAFSFFSIFSWAGLVFFAWRRYQEGAASAFAPSTYDQDFAAGGIPPYGYPGGPQPGGTESYQEPPFTASNEAAGNAPQYKQPAY